MNGELTDEQTIAELEETVTAMGEAFTAVWQRAWDLSQWGTLTAMSRLLAGAALLHLGQHPEHRVAILDLLRRVVDAVECDAATKH